MTTFAPDCTRFENDLKAYADGELSWPRRRAVRRHLTHCASCREEIVQMTQISEDLRAAEPGEAISPDLRAKILQASGTKESSVAERLSLNSSPALEVPGRLTRKRLAPAWAFVALAVVAWFICYPMFGKVHEESRRVGVLANFAPMRSPQVASNHLQYVVPPPENLNGAAPSVQSPTTFTVRLSDRQAGTSNGNVYLKIKNPDSLFLNGAGKAQTFDSNANTLAPDTPADALRQVHKEASIGIQVPNPEATGDTLNQMVQETGGYVAANNLSTGPDGMKSGELIVKVPVAQFETFLSQVAKLGVVQSKNITGEDITEKTSDADQTENVLEGDLQQSEARLKSLGSKAKWHDQEATRDLRIQLAQARARLVLLKRMAALGTLTIDLSQTPKAVVAPPVTGGFLNTLKAATHDALQSLVGSAGALLALVIWLLAYAPIWVPLLLIGRYVLKEYRKRETAG